MFTSTYLARVWCCRDTYIYACIPGIKLYIICCFLSLFCSYNGVPCAKSLVEWIKTSLLYTCTHVRIPQCVHTRIIIIIIMIITHCYHIPFHSIPITRSFSMYIYGYMNMIFSSHTFMAVKHMWKFDFKDISAFLIFFFSTSNFIIFILCVIHSISNYLYTFSNIDEYYL